MKYFGGFRLYLVLMALSLIGQSQVAQSQSIQEWVARYNDTGNGDDESQAMAIDARSNIYITGYSSGIGWDFATAKYNSQGVQQWVVRYDAPGHGDDVPTAITVDAQGYVYVVGYGGSSGPFNKDYITLKYDSLGRQQWVQLYNGPANGTDQALALAVDNAGNVYVTGASWGGPTDYDLTTIKYNAAGVQQWIQRFNSSFNWEDTGRKLILDAAGNIYITGISGEEPGNYDVITMKYDNSGNLQWEQRYNGPSNSNDAGLDLKLNAALDVIVAGYSAGSGPVSDMVILKYSNAGAQQWVARYNGPGNGYDCANIMALDSAGNIYVTGYATGTNGTSDFATLKFNPDGAQQWVSFYIGPVNGFEQAYGLALDASGAVYITGYSPQSSSIYVNYDYATIKYDNNGRQQWVQRYNGPGNDLDVAMSLVLDSAANVYVTGESTGSGTLTDFATVRYSPPGIVLTPVNLPIQIPAAGGSFDYNATISNHLSHMFSFQVWTDVTLPSGSSFGPVLGPVSLTLPGAASLARLRTQSVPGSAPAGDYVYHGYTGVYPDTIWNSSSFPFTKLGSGTRDSGFGDWTCIGEPFPDEIGETRFAVSVSGSGATPSMEVSSNPFNSSTVLSYQLQATSQVSLQVYDTAGKLVATLVDGWQEAGTHSITFDGSGLPSGVYLYRLTAGPNTASGKMVLLK